MNDIIKSDYWNLYNPDWKKDFDYHLGEENRLREEYPLEERSEEITQKMSDHRNGWKQTFITQFKNGSEYADFMIQQLKHEAEMHKLIWVQIDTSQIKTPAEAQALYSYTSSFIDTQIKEKKGSLPSLKNSTLFAQENTYSSHAHFNGFWGSVTDTIITMQKENEGQVNICFSELKNNTGPSVTNDVEHIAKQIYITKLYEEYPDPDKINWYIHLPAGITGTERFSKIKMDYINGSFRNCEFNSIGDVPQAIKMATFNAEQNDMGLVKAQSALENDKPNFVTRAKKFLGLNNTP